MKHISLKSILSSILSENIYAEEIDVNSLEIGDTVKYTNPASDKKFSKDISFFTNTPKNKSIPFEVYIKNGSIGKIVKLNSKSGIASVKFDSSSFTPDSIRTDIPYDIHIKYLKKV